jgi:adenosylcobyric acid synthase
MCRIADRVTGLEGLDGMSVGNVYGTYVHGIFDAEGVASAVVRALAEKKGMDIEWTGQADAMSYQAFKETQYDLLADALREHLDMEMIYQIME